MQLAWIGGDRVVVTMSGMAVWAYDVGRRTDLDPRTAGQLPPPLSPSVADETQASEARTLVEAKLPDRNVVVLGCDQLRHRFLLRAVGGGGERFFVYDRANDLLYEVGSNARGQ